MHSDDTPEHDPFKILFLAVAFLFFIYVTLYSLYDLCWLRRSRSQHIRSSRSRSLNRRPTMVFINPSHIAPRGLDPAIVKSLPVFTFSDVTHKDLTDCPVCLSEFEEGESGRVLPGCKHAFHVECIDMWFLSHSTCPLCRSLVQPPLSENVTMVEERIPISPEPVYAAEPGSTSGSESSAMPLEDSGREPAAVELENDLTHNVRANSSFTLSMNQMLSFTRMLSRKGRSAPSSFAGGPSRSPSSSCRIVINELDIEQGGEEIK